MELKELTIEKQIEALKYAKKDYIEYFSYISEFNTGMCFSIRMALKKLFNINVSLENIYILIPTFTIDHLIDAYINKKVEMIAPSNNIYWWDKNDNKSRIAAFDFLINELESKL